MSLPVLIPIPPTCGCLNTLARNTRRPSTMWSPHDTAAEAALEYLEARDLDRAAVCVLMAARLRPVGAERDLINSVILQFRSCRLSILTGEARRRHRATLPVPECV